MNRRADRGLVVAAGLLLAALPALAETRIEKNLTLAPGGAFRLETDMGSVTVTGSPDAGAHIVITSKRKELEDILTFRFEEGAASASVVARKKHLTSSWFSSNGGSVHYEIRVPAQTKLTVDTSGGSIHVSGMRLAAKLDTSGGSISVRDLVGDLDGDTSGGSIDLKNIKGRVRVETSGGGIEAASIDGPVHAQSSGGSIELQKVTGDIDADTSGGSIRIVEAGGRVRADTSGGGIEASFTKGNSRGGSLETSGGGIEVSVDSGADLAIDASGSSVKADIPILVHGEISRGSLQGTLGKGGNTLRLHTSGGSVRIQAL
jgi:DUF4097 and DUF4098 domain-containing protein YvlB